MIESLKICNFKSVDAIEIKVSPLTLLTGLNGAGKSTILHSLALLRQSWEENSRSMNLHLRGNLLKLGRGRDVRHENAKTDELMFSYTENSNITTWRYFLDPLTDVLPLNTRSENYFETWLNKPFQFIQADRLVPKTLFEQASQKERRSSFLGCHGEFTVDYLALNKSQKISPKRTYSISGIGTSDQLFKKVAPTDTLMDQTCGWLQQLSPGVKFDADLVPLADNASLRFSYASGTQDEIDSSFYRPTNVGFGLTYCLPIIVACLTAPPGSLLLLENPEAHLHPQGQAALGMLMAQAASDGVQIIVESHSDHVLNGIRLAVKNNKIITHHDAIIHYFSRDIEKGATNITPITINEHGRLSNWPEGFFDQWSKSLDELLD